MARVTSSKVSVFASHGMVLLHLSRQPESTMREMALVFGLSERRIARILRDLTDADMIRITKRGKRNTYAINEDAVCAHPTIDDLRLGDIVRAAAPRETVAPRPIERRNTSPLLHGLLMPFLGTESESVIGVLPAVLPLFA